MTAVNVDQRDRLDVGNNKHTQREQDRRVVDDMLAKTLWTTSSD